MPRHKAIVARTKTRTLVARTRTRTLVARSAKDKDKDFSCKDKDKDKDLKLVLKDNQGQGHQGQGHIPALEDLFLKAYIKGEGRSHKSWVGEFLLPPALQFTN